MYIYARIYIVLTQYDENGQWRIMIIHKMGIHKMNRMNLLIENTNDFIVVSFPKRKHTVSRNVSIERIDR